MDDLTEHYGNPELLAVIEKALFEKALLDKGLDPTAPTVEDLAPVDEFHVGGRPATRRLLDQVAIGGGAHLLDIGCGIGGTARHLASDSSVRVTGIDLTEDFVATGQVLNRLVGLDDRIELRTGSALELPFPDAGLHEAGFDGAVMLHVGMNIADKGGLMMEVSRVLRPGAWFAIYDLMRSGPGQIDFPVPWASAAASSQVATSADYRQAAVDAGLEVVAEADRTAEAVAFFDRMRGGGPPSPLGLHLIMGPEAPTKLGNMVAAIRGGVLAPTELIVRRF